MSHKTKQTVVLCVVKMVIFARIGWKCLFFVIQQHQQNKLVSVLLLY